MTEPPTELQARPQTEQPQTEQPQTERPQTMPPPQSPAELAAAIGAARQRLIGFIGGCTEGDWQTAPLPGDPRPVGVVADHVAHSYEYLASWLRGALCGRPPAVSGDIVDELNAAHAAAGLVSRAEVVAHLHRSGDAIIELVAGLRPADLDAADGRVQRLTQVAIGHADSHRSDIEAALTADIDRDEP